MCGIAGVIGIREQVLAAKMLEKIRHRGPDAENIWLSPSGSLPVTLCHTRLSILDLSSSGLQPFHSQDERYSIVFNGEIYNFLELREELIVKYNIHFRSRTDTEVLLYGLINEGIDFLIKCNGMWAFCLWDCVESKALLCRDRFGIKPLYYSLLDGGKLGFSSEMKGLSPLLSSIQPSEYIDLMFSDQFNYEFSDICAIAGITRLPAASYATYQYGRLSIAKWWNTLDYLNASTEPYSNQVEHWRQLFIDSVRLRMRSDVPIGTALSGGLDSSSVLAAMSSIGKTTTKSSDRLSNDWQHGVCCSFQGSSLDETQWASDVAESCGIKFSSVLIDPLSSSSGLLNSLAQVEDPYLTMPLPMIETYKAIKDKGISVTLDGHGADELFSGYGHLKLAVSSAKNIREFQEILDIENSTRTGIYSTKETISIADKLKTRIKFLLSQQGLYPISAIKRSFLNNYSCFRDNSELNSRLQNERNIINDHDRFKDMDLFSQVLYEIFHLTILPTLLRNYDRYSMINGLEMRMPFMDWRLVCYTFSLPWQSKIGGSYSKRIQRDSLDGILIDPVRLRRDKIGWNAPAHEWFKGPLKPFLDNELATLDDSPYSNMFRIGCKKFERLKDPCFSDGQHLWNSILPSLWLKSLRQSPWK